MIVRGVGEFCIHYGVRFVNGAEPRVRQAGNAALRAAGLWDELTAKERDLMASPDGEWTIEEAKIRFLRIWREQLRLLRWILGMDSELEPVNHLLPTDAELT